MAWLGGLTLLALWLRGTSTGTLREELKVWQFWSLEICVLLGIVVAIGTWAGARSGLARRDGLWMTALAGFAVALTLLVAPRANRIFYDEHIYQGIGQNLADARLAQVCNDGQLSGGRLRCASGEYNKQPYAYPHLLSVAYRIAGVHEWVAFAVNAAVMAFTACAVYLLAIALFGDRQAAIFAALLIAIIPEQLMWSATAAVEPSASLACALALLCAANYGRRGGSWRAAALVISSAYAVQFRAESVLILPVAGALAWPRLRSELSLPRGWWLAVSGLVLLAAHIGHLFAVRSVAWGTDAPRFSLGYVIANFRVNGRFYLIDERFPVVVTLLALLGLLAERSSRDRWLLALYFFLFFGIDLVFYAGSYNYGADVRYSLMTYPPLAVLGGLGAARLARWSGTLAPALPGAAVVGALLGFQFLWYAPVVRGATEGAWAARADVQFARRVAAQLPPESYVLTQNPAMFHLWGVNAGQMSQVLAVPAYAKVLETRFTGGIYVHWNFWCNVQDPAQPEICRRAMALGHTDLVTEYRERDQRYAFYRLKIAN
ncbi:MAG: glycosyltransferase family 39 protein [Vicinamibacterales bacterium]